MPQSKNIDLTWVEKQTNTYRRRFSRYKRFAKILKDLLEMIAKKHEIEAIVHSRPKAVASFSEKIIRKGSKYKDPVNQFTDLCGARAITQTQSQVSDMCEIIEKYFDIDWENSVGVEKRLKPTEFGYRSVHYIIELKDGSDYEREYGVKPPKSVFGLKAEIQVRTLLEHAWADLYHKWAYKNEFDIPIKLEREMAGIAARLEAADNAFSGVQEELKNYYTSYGTYLDAEQLSKEIDKLEVTLKYDPDNISLVKQLGRAALTLEEWDKVIYYLTPYETSDNYSLIKILGTALCKKYKDKPETTAFLKGQELLLKAGSPPYNNADALASLAGSWKGIDEDKSNEFYRKAFELDPTDAYPLGNYLENEILKDQNLSIIGFTRPIILDAIKRNLSCIEISVNLPWAWYDIGKFKLLLNDPYASFSAYAKAIHLSTAPFMLETSLDSLLRLRKIQAQIPGYDWIVNMLWLGLASKFNSDRAKKEIRKMAKTIRYEANFPTIILAGGSSIDVQEKMESYSPLLMQAFSRYEGWIISGGSTNGISKLTGDLKEAYPENIHTVGYLPATKDSYADLDKARYDEIRATNGDSFSPLEATQYWMDLLESGIHPESVKLLVINGGKISSAECTLALMLGAQLGIIEGSGGEPVKLFSDSNWEDLPSLMQLPDDPLILDSFISSGRFKMDKKFRDIVAKEIHERYLNSKVENLETDDPSMQPWESLEPGLKHSNYSQADHIFELLDRFGYGVKKAPESKVKIYDLDKDKDVVEQMAKLEHARWVVERLSKGWKLAAKKDVAKKLSPYLVEWDSLTEEIKDYDRNTVREIPSYLAKVGLKIHKMSE